MVSTAGIALLGCGTVGACVAERLLYERDVIERRSGVHYELRAIAIRDATRTRIESIDTRLFTTDPRAIVEDSRVDIVIECIGGTAQACELIEIALERGRSVVTANKDVLATQGPRLQALAAARGAGLRYEAAACGAIPVVRMLYDALAGDRIDALAGVVNGTCNAILSEMDAGSEFAEAVAAAQARGYAEADPSNDIDGVDAAHKLAVLMQLAFGLAVISPRIRHTGIAGVTKREIARAQALGYRIRLIAAAARCDDGAFAGVAPLLVPRDHPFATLSGPENIVRVAARDAGPLTMRGRGAGGPATASAILGDVVSSLRALGERRDVARQLRALEPALDVAPIFTGLPRHPELPRYALWDDTLLDAPVSHAQACVVMTGKGTRHSMSITLETDHPQSFDTVAVHGGHNGDPATKSRAVPIYQTTSYLFDSTEHAGKLFALEEFGNIYTRINNPTTDVFEQRVAALERGAGALAVSSGQAAVVYSILNLAKNGDHLVSSASLYGGTYNAFTHTLKRFGIEVSLVDFNDPHSVEAAIRPNTKALFAETIGNPKIDVLDVELYAELAHRHGLPLIVDNTLATPYLLRPIEHGADIVVHSATKFIGGHGTAIGGVIVDGGTFDWTINPRFAEFIEPDPSYHGLQYAAAFGNIAYIVKARVQLLRNIGAALSPFNAWLLLQGIETLGLRVERHSSNALAVAEFLSQHPRVTSVAYPGLPGDPAHERARKYLPNGAGAIVTFSVEGGEREAKSVIDRLRLFSLLANVGDAKSLVIHPASTTHQQLSDAERLQSGVDASTVRLSVGIEDINDIIADLRQALAD